MADQRSGWRRDRDRARNQDEDRDWYRRTEDYGRGEYGRGAYGRGEQARGEDWRRAEPEGDWRRVRDDRERGYGREDWGRRDWAGRDRDAERDYWGDRGRYGREDSRGYGREDWGRDYGGGIGRRPMGGGAPGRAWGYDESWGRDPGWDRGWAPSGYGRAGYGRDRYGEREDYGNRDRDRGWWDRASDEVSSWFGDEQAERRRERDERRDYYRGRGPRGYTRSDERIREDVSDRLTDNPILDASEIDVAVSAGEVTLNGAVDSRYSKRLAEDLSEEVSGVTHVQNNLRIRNPERDRGSISGTYSGISEGGATSDMGRTSGSGVGSTGTGNTSSAMTGGTAAGKTRGGTDDTTAMGGTTLTGSSAGKPNPR